MSTYKRNAGTTGGIWHVCDGKQIERVSEFKILGLQLSNNLKWDCNIDLICKKMSSKLYFLKLLKRAGLSIEDYSNKANLRVCMSGITTSLLH